MVRAWIYRLPPRGGGHGGEWLHTCSSDVGLELEAAGQTDSLSEVGAALVSGRSCTSMQGEGWMEDGPGGQEDSSAVTGPGEIEVGTVVKAMRVEVKNLV